MKLSASPDKIALQYIHQSFLLLSQGHLKENIKKQDWQQRFKFGLEAILALDDQDALQVSCLSGTRMGVLDSLSTPSAFKVSFECLAEQLQKASISILDTLCSEIALIMAQVWKNDRTLHASCAKVLLTVISSTQDCVRKPYLADNYSSMISHYM